MGPLLLKGCVAFLYSSKVKLELVPTIKTRLRRSQRNSLEFWLAIEDRGWTFAPEGATKDRRIFWLRVRLTRGTLRKPWVSFLFLKWRKTNGLLLFCSPVKCRIRVYKLWVFVLRLEINWKQYWVVRWLFLEEQVKTLKSYGYGRVN